MALRFASESKSWSDGLTWKAEIWDSAFEGDDTPFVFGSGGIEIQWHQGGGDVYAPVLGSSVSFEMMIQDETHEQLIADLAGAGEGRFTIIIYKDEAFFWAGVVNAPELSIEDFDFPYGFVIGAVDGLALLKNYEYRQDITSETKWYDKYEGQSRIVSIIARCLKKLPHVVTHFAESDPFIVTAINWYSDFSTDPESDSETSDPFWEHFVDNRAFVTGQVSGNGKFLSCYDVISHVLRRFHAQIALFDGYFKCEQFEHRSHGTGENYNYARSYDYDITAPSDFALSASQNVGGGDDVKRLRGGTVSFLTALKATRAKQTANALQNLMPAALFSSDSAPTYLVGDVYGNGLSTYIRCSGTIEWELENTDIPANSVVVGVFNLTVALDGEYAERTIDFYPNPTGTFEYSSITWSGSPAAIQIAVKLEVAATGETWTGQESFDLLFRTPSTFAYGDLQISFDADELYYFNFTGENVLDGADYSLGWVLKDPYLVVQKSRTAFAPKAVFYEVRGEENNTQVLESESILGDLTGDIVNQWGGILFFTDPDYEYTTAWASRALPSPGRPIAQLFAERTVSHRFRPRRVFRGNIVGGALEAQTPIYIQSFTPDAIYWFSGGKYLTVRDELHGEWTENEFTATEFDYLEPEYDTGNYEPDTPGGGSTGGGGAIGNGGAGVPPGVADGNGIYSGSGTVPDGTVVSLVDDMFFEGGDGSSISITTGTTAGGRVLTGFNGASISFLDSGGENTVSVGNGGVIVTLNGSVGDFMQVNGLAKYAADYSADYDDRTLVDKEYVDNNSGTGDINNGGNTTGGAITIGTNDNFALNFETNNITRQSIATDGAHTISANHTATTSVKNALTIQVNNDSGAGGNGYGGAILFQGESSTTVNRDMVKITGEWQVATDASRLARCRIYGIGAGQVLVEMVRFDNNIGPNMVIGGTGMVYSSNSITTSSGNISLTNSAATGDINLTVSGSTVGNTINVGGLTSFSQTTGNKSVTTFANSFSVASGSATFYNIRISPTINQTGSASGATGAIIFAPNLTSIGSKWSALTSATSNANALFIKQTGANSYSTHVGAFGFGAATVPTDKLEVTGNVALLAAGNKIKIATGSNASVGTATLVGGTVTVNTTAVATGSTIFLTCNTPGGTQGFLSAPSASITNATSFVINSSSGADTSTVNWWIIN